jgi:outer membrane protein assembly factor BamE (lipoprotein component of BamABCDE complex)
MKDRDYYLGVLGVGPGATPGEIRSAYLDLVKVWHPDRFTHDFKLRQKAQEKLKDINEAFDWLKANFSASDASASARPNERPPHRPKPAAERGASATAPKASATPPPRSGAPAGSNRSPTWAWLVILITLAIWRSIATNDSKPPQPPPAQPKSSPAIAPPVRAGTSKPDARADSSARRGSPNTIEARNTSALKVRKSASDSEPKDASPGSKEGLPKRAASEVLDYPSAVEGTHSQTVLRPTEASGYFTAGSTKEEVVAAQGTPTAFSDNVWRYRSSSVYFKDGRVTSWDIWPGSPLKVEMLPSTPVQNSLGYFMVGSTKDEVLAAQGTPTAFSDNVWKYRSSSVYFKDGRVTNWDIWPGSPLNVRMSQK